MEPLKIHKIIKKYQETIPVNIYELCSELGIKVYEMPFDDDNTSGLISKKQRANCEAGKSGYYIILNQNHSEVRKIFTTAHEIGHYIQDRNVLEKEKTIYELELFRNDEGRNKMETRADIFATELLMPKDKILEEYKKYKEAYKKAKEDQEKLDYTNSIKLSLGAAYNLSSLFITSETTMKVRLKEFGLLY